MKKIGKIIGMVISILVLAGCLAGCEMSTPETAKVKDIEFTVVPETEIPKEVADFVEVKKKEEMQNTYTTGEDMYLIVGYGEQKTSGYSISVNDCYLGQDAIYLDTSLIGPAKGEEIDEVPTYPYIVIKIEKRDEAVVFQ